MKLLCTFIPWKGLVAPLLLRVELNQIIDFHSLNDLNLSSSSFYQKAGKDLNLNHKNALFSVYQDKYNNYQIYVRQEFKKRQQILLNVLTVN